MKFEFPAAVPEIPVKEYRDRCGCTTGTIWVLASTGAVTNSGWQASARGACRMFLANEQARKQKRQHGTNGDLAEHEEQRRSGCAPSRVERQQRQIALSAPESKPGGLHEFTAADLDGNLFHVFYDFGTSAQIPALLWPAGADR